jgi:hypothetical protein
MAAKGGKAGGGAGPKASQQQALGAAGAATEGGRQQTMQGRKAGLGLQQQGEALGQQRQLGMEAMAGQRQTAEGAMAMAGGMGAAGRTAQLGEAAKKSEAQERMQIRQINSSMEQQIKKMTTDKGIQETNIFQQFRQSTDELELRKDGAEIEQRMHELFMRDQSYMDELSRVARKRQLTNKLNFQDETSRITLGNSLSETISKLGFERAFNAKGREWNQQLKGMGIEKALEVAKAMQKDRARGQMIGGVMGMGSMMIGGYFGGDQGGLAMKGATGGTSGGQQSAYDYASNTPRVY